MPRDEYEGFDDDFLSEYSDEEILEEACNNSYNIIIGESTYEDIIKSKLELETSITAFAHDTENGPSKEDMESIMTYFEGTEEYEKCIVLQEEIKKLNKSI